VQRKACTVRELIAEFKSGPTPGSAALRAALAEVSDGVRAVSEADFRRLILHSGLPKPVFNARLIDEDGTLIAIADAWWQDAGVSKERLSDVKHYSLDNSGSLNNGLSSEC
jgi:hypothetical protein